MKRHLSPKILGLCLGILCCLVTRANVYYWVGGSGSWSMYSTHWATASGGVLFHIQTPTPNDTVVFDANSFTAPG
ncbi:MAG TPA: hypothetical protein VNZ86_00230, partial [Bacteroidia bacterium]|nr:hypothetical protein [Bacteroidia bacterium]